MSYEILCRECGCRFDSDAEFVCGRESCPSEKFSGDGVSSQDWTGFFHGIQAVSFPDTKEEDSEEE